MVNLCIPVHCKEYRHTERNRSIQEVQEAHGLRRILDVQVVREIQQSLKGLGVQSCSLLMDLEVPSVLSLQLLKFLDRLSLLEDLSLPAGRAIRNFRGIRSFLWRPALHGVLDCQEVQEGPEGLGYCCGTCCWGFDSITS